MAVQYGTRNGKSAAPVSSNTNTSTGGSSPSISPTSSGGVDQTYYLQPGESSSAYTARIAEYNTAKATEAGAGGVQTPQKKQTGIMTADISTPANMNKKVPAPAVVTSGAAERDLANKRAQASQLQSDTLQHQAMTSQPMATPAPVEGASTPAPAPSKPQTLDEQLNSVLGGLNENQGQIQQETSDIVNPLMEEQQRAQNEFDISATTALKKLNQIASGTYPLSASEKSLLSSTEDTYQATIAAQQTANAGYTGQMTELMASLGIQTSAPTQAIGMIHAAISTGEQKVADLNAKMATKLAELQQGFQEKDYNMVSDAWDKTSGYMKERITSLKDMQTQVLTAAHQQQQDLKDYAELTLKTMIDSANFSYKEKQDAIDNSFKKMQINETQRHNLATEALTRDTNGAGGGTFTTTQINSGAAKAGVPVDVFRGWSADAKNAFINGNPEGTKKSIDDALATGSVADVQTAIDEMDLPTEVKTYFKNYAAGNDTGESSLDKRTGAFADTFTDLMNQGYDRNEALDEVTSEWTDGGKSPLTKVDDRIIHDALTKIYGGVFAPNDKTSDGTLLKGTYNDGTGLTRFGR